MSSEILTFSFSSALDGSRISLAERRVISRKPSSIGSMVTSRSRPESTMRAIATLSTCFIASRMTAKVSSAIGPSGRQIVGGVQVDRVDVAGVDEAVDVDGLAGLDLDLVQLLVGDDDVAVLLELVALHQVGAVDLAELRVVVLLLHAVQRVLVQKVEGDLAGASPTSPDRASPDRRPATASDNPSNYARPAMATPLMSSSRRHAASSA